MGTFVATREYRKQMRVGAGVKLVDGVAAAMFNVLTAGDNIFGTYNASAAGANCLIGFLLGHHNNTASNLKFGSQTFTEIGTLNEPALSLDLKMVRLLNPASGTQNVTLSFAGVDNRMTVYVSSFRNVSRFENFTGTYDDIATTVDIADLPVTSDKGHMVVGALGAYNANWATRTPTLIGNAGTNGSNGNPYVLEMLYGTRSSPGTVTVDGTTDAATVKVSAGCDVI
jgi:hypothetical protein